MARTEAQLMVSAMGMGMKILELLEKKVREHKGNPEVLAFLTRPRFEKNLDEIAQAIVGCDWRIPLSEMRFLAEKAYRENYEFDESILDEVRNLWWWLPLIDLGIPFEKFSDNPSDGYRVIPDKIRRQLSNKRMEYPLFVDDEKKYVVVLLNTKNNVDFVPGDFITPGDIEMIHIAESRYFNFES